MVHSIGGLWDSTETREAYSSRSSRAWAAEARSYLPPPGSAFRRCAEGRWHWYWKRFCAPASLERAPGAPGKLVGRATRDPIQCVTARTGRLQLELPCNVCPAVRV